MACCDFVHKEVMLIYTLSFAMGSKALNLVLCLLGRSYLNSKNISFILFIYTVCLSFGAESSNCYTPVCY